MPLTYQDLLPGDILLCYGWNPTAGLQLAAKTLARLTLLPVAREIIFKTGTLGYATSDPVGVGASDAACNHAIMIGNTQHELQTSEGRDVRVPLEEDDQVTHNADPDGTVTVTITSSQGKVRVLDVSQGIRDKGFLFGGVRPNRQDGQRQLIVNFIKDTYKDIPLICHSTGNGCGFTLANSYFGDNAGRKLAVYRFVPPSNGTDSGLAARAGLVATTWANTLIDGESTQYSIPKAVMASFGRSAYGLKAAARVAKYRQNRALPGGPPTDQTFIKSGPLRNMTRNGKKEWFCSMFVIACFQAATDNDNQVKQYLPFDARYTLPMGLHGFLSRSSSWRLVGTQAPAP